MSELRPIYSSWSPYIFVLLLLVAAGLYYVLGGEQAHEVINGIACAVSLGMAIGFSANVCRSIKRHPWEWEAEDAMILGVFSLGVSLCVIFVGLWGYRLTDDQWWRTNIIFYLARVGMITGLTVMMTAVHSVNGKLPRAAYVRTGWIVGGAAMFSLLMISLGFS